MKFCGTKTLNSMFGKTQLVPTYMRMAGAFRLLLPCVAAFPFFRTDCFVKTKISKKSALAVHNFLEIININPQAVPGSALAWSCPWVN